MAKNELKCCEFCGRDTRGRICHRCFHHGRTPDYQEHRGRSSRKWDVINGSPIGKSADDDDEVDRYHGETERDDI